MAVLERESWVRDRGAAATVIDAAPQGWSTAFSVHRRPDGTLRYVTKINEFLGDTVATGTSASPAGPFSRTPVAHYPSRVRPGENLYTALALPSLPLEGGGMLMSICRNSMHLGTVLADAEFYKPQFFEGRRCRAQRRCPTSPLSSPAGRAPGGHVELGSARELKTELLSGLQALVRAAADAEPTVVAVGVVPRGNDFRLALRVSSAAALQLPAVDEVLRRWGTETEVRVVGRVRASSGSPAGGRSQSADHDPPPEGRVLLPGASVAHPDVTAGTLGGFVRDGSGRVLLLSNNHVLADTDRAVLGDPVLSPGPADGGRPERDRVATLTGFERLRPDGNLLDLAVAAVDDPERIGGNVVPEGELCGATEELLDGLAVAKVGRTTGHTTGTVTAVELDGVTVDYGRGDLFTFDDCMEVEGDLSAFSAGGDSGSLVYERRTREVLGLLFAGSTTGGANGAGLTFCNPAALALRAAAAELL